MTAADREHAGIGWLTGRVGVAPFPVRSAILAGTGVTGGAGPARPAVLIDPGLDRAAARRLLDLLRPAGLYPETILVTHGHADHFGAAAPLAEQAGRPLAVYASAEAADLIRHPGWEPFILAGGARPWHFLRGAATLGAAYPEVRILTSGPVQIGPWSLEVLELPGHAPGHLGYLVDGVLFAGDAVYGEEVLTRYPLPVHADPQVTAETLARLGDRIRAGGLHTLVPAHGSPARGEGEALRLVEANRQRILHARQRVAETLRKTEEPVTESEALRRVFARVGLRPREPRSALVLRAAVLGYIAWLAAEGRVEVGVRDGVLTFRWNG